MIQFLQKAIVIILRLGLRTLIMKKIILCLLFFIFLLPQAAFSSDNFIYSIDVSRDSTDKNVVLNIKSDYMTKITNKVGAIFLYSLIKGVASDITIFPANMASKTWPESLL